MVVLAEADHQKVHKEEQIYDILLTLPLKRLFLVLKKNLALQKKYLVIRAKALVLSQKAVLDVQLVTEQVKFR